LSLERGQGRYFTLAYGGIGALYGYRFRVGLLLLLTRVCFVIGVAYAPDGLFQRMVMVVVNDERLPAGGCNIILRV